MARGATSSSRPGHRKTKASGSRCVAAELPNPRADGRAPAGPRLERGCGRLRHLRRARVRSRRPCPQQQGHRARDGGGRQAHTVQRPILVGQQPEGLKLVPAQVLPAALGETVDEERQHLHCAETVRSISRGPPPILPSFRTHERSGRRPSGSSELPAHEDRRRTGDGRPPLSSIQRHAWHAAVSGRGRHALRERLCSALCTFSLYITSQPAP